MAILYFNWTAKNDKIIFSSIPEQRGSVPSQAPTILASLPPHNLIMLPSRKNLVLHVYTAAVPKSNGAVMSGL